MMHENKSSTEALAHIDRRIALVFGSLILVILLAVFSLVGLYYQHVVEQGEDELTSMLSNVLGDSINRIGFSGKYHARLMIEEVVEAQPQLRYIMIVDGDGRVVAHSDAAMNDKFQHDEGMPLAMQVMKGRQRVIQELVYKGVHVKDVAIPYRGGYRDELMGVIRVGISKEQTHQSLVRGWMYLLLLLLLLLTLAVVLSSHISSRFGRPIKRLAWELQGILEHAPLLIYIRDSQGNILTASRSFMRAFNLDDEAIKTRRVDELPAGNLASEPDAMQEDFADNGAVHDLVRVPMEEEERVFMRTRFAISRDRDGNPLDVCVAAVDITQRVQMEQALEQSKAALSQIAEERHLLLEHAKDFFYKQDREGRFTYLSSAVTQISGYSPEEWARDHRTYLTDSPINDKARSYTEETLRTGREHPPYLAEIRARDGRIVMLEVSERPFHEAGEVAGIVGVARDISDRYRAEVQLAQEKELAQVTLKSIGDAVISTDSEGRINYLNPIAEHLTGWQNEEARGHLHSEVFVILDEAERREVESPIGKVLELNHIYSASSESRQILLSSRDGHFYSIEDSAAPIRDNSGETVGVVLVFRDVTATRELTNRIHYQASHDALTDLINRTEFERQLSSLLAETKGRTLSHSVLYIDLDQFKVINDTAGHMAGDALLQQLARLLEGRVRRRDSLARLGGDEFGLLLEECPLEQARKIADALLQDIQALRFVWEGKPYTFGASIGLVSIDSSVPHDVQSVMIAADSACFLAKESGRNRIQVYHPGDSEMAQLHGMFDWVSRINEALEEDRFELHYQKIDPAVPDVPVRRQHIEVLVRMLDEDGRVVSPENFIPAAERYNLMPSVDRWVITSLFSRYHQLERRPELLIAINLSGASLSDENMYQFIISRFERYGVPYEAICFEITETAAIANIDKARRFIDRLRSLGCGFALDDFGSGLSSFAYLKNLHVDFLKIDGSFVRDIDEDEVDLAMVDAICRIGDVMKVRTIAEHVESEAIRQRLQQLGVDMVQGYGVHRPEALAHLHHG